MRYTSARRLLFALPPELSHRVALEALRLARKVGWPLPGGPLLAGRTVERMGLRFANSVGLAAGFDKNGDFVDALGALGFGFIEIGTITPHAQAGNAKPRVFRLPEHVALINRMGSPNKGVAHALARIRGRTYSGVLGVNIGKNAATPLAAAVEDYVHGYRAVRDHADYVSLNVSSPNTLGLRELQGRVHLQRIVAALVAERDAHVRRTPVLVKLSPDFDAAEFADVAATIAAAGADGVIATNSTTSRDGMALHDPRLREGGLSGEPLHARSTATIRALRGQLGPGFTIIGVGGITTAAAAMETLAAGADLVQIYTGLVYRGPQLVADIARSA